jgi:hypothetical protein
MKLELQEAPVFEKCFGRRSSDSQFFHPLRPSSSNESNIAKPGENRVISLYTYLGRISMRHRNHVALYLVLSTFLLYLNGGSYAQEKKQADIPKEQMPVHERDRGDSFIENLGELPGRIITFPLFLLSKGISKTAGFVIDNQYYLTVTDWLTNEDGTRKVRPVFSPPGGGGVTFKQENLFTHGMTFRARGSFGKRSRRLFEGSLTDPQLFSQKFGLLLAGFQERKPDEDFFGVGNFTLEADETNFLIEESNFEVDLLSAPLTNVQFFAGFSYENVDIEEGRDSKKPSIDELFTADQIPGLLGAEMWSAVFKIYHDSRDALGHPTRGGEEYLSVEFSGEVDGSQFGFRKYKVDLRRYLELFHKRVIALRFRTEITDNMSGRQIPFYRLPGLGEQDVLSGYRPVRFRDRDLMLAGLEYRFPIHGIAVATFFIEEGRVFSDVFDEFSLDDWKYSYGGGLRITGLDGGLITSIGIARSKEQTRFVFGLNVELRSF